MKILIEINGDPFELSVSDAKQLYTELKLIFSKDYTYPVVPLYPDYLKPPYFVTYGGTTKPITPIQGEYPSISEYKVESSTSEIRNK